MKTDLTVDYFEIPAHLWSKRLDLLKRRGFSAIITRVLWGVHEKALRMRDFSRASSRDLEKFLCLVAERGLTVDLQFGFPAHTKTFPEWVFGLPGKALVPQVLWEQRRDGFGLVPIPSLRERVLAEGYLEFLEEALNVIAPHCGIRGPVKRVGFDFGIYEADVSVVEETEFVRRLRTRYSGIAQLNERYGTSFRNFDALEHKQGVRLLIDRRPWMAAFDYKWCRAQDLLQLWAKIWKLSVEKQMTKVFCSSLNAQFGEKTDPTSLEIAFDSVHIDSTGGCQFPFMPEGLISEASLKVFRLWEQVKNAAKEMCVPMRLLPLWDEVAVFSSNILVVICGKYLPRASFCCVEKFLERGGQVFFPFGVPKYDETMDYHNWASRCEPELTAGEDLGLLRMNRTPGVIWLPSPNFKYEKGFYDRVVKYGEWITNNQTNARA